jgi:hypothetical protein
MRWLCEPSRCPSVSTVRTPIHAAILRVPRRCTHRPSALGGDDAPPPAPRPSYLAHPLIAQREALRQFYLTFQPIEQLEVVRSTAEHLDSHTLLHMLCNVADNASKGLLLGTPAEQDALMSTLYKMVADEMLSMPVRDLGAILWCLSSVTGGGDWKADVVALVAGMEGGGTQVPSYSTKDLINILMAAGALCRVAPRQPHVESFILELMAELTSRMDASPYVKGSFTARDLSELATVSARVFGNGDSSVPPAAERLLDTVAGDVRRQLANRHSSRTAFNPRELVQFLAGYAALGMHTAAVDGMFDAVVAFVVGRIRARHLNAVTRPGDVAAVLGAYARQGHRSVAVPELLTAAGEQLRRNAAQEQEALAAERAGEGAVAGGAPDLTCPIPTLISVLESHETLGFSPDGLTLTALVPGLRRELPTASPDEALRLLALFDVFQFSPGPRTVELLVAQVDEGTAVGAPVREQARAAAVALLS